MKKTFSALIAAVLLYIPASASATPLIADAVASGRVFDGTGFWGTFLKDTVFDAIGSGLNPFDTPTGLSHGVVEFDLAGLGPLDTINSAILHLRWAGCCNSSPRDLEIRGYAGNGVAEIADGSAGGGLLGTVTHTTTALDTFWITGLDVTSFVQSLVSGSATHAGIVLNIEDEYMALPATGISFFTETSSESVRPFIDIDFTVGESSEGVPTPGALVLLGFGLLGLGAARRRAA